MVTLTVLALVAVLVRGSVAQSLTAECSADVLNIVGWNSEARPTTDGQGWTFVFSGGEKEIPCNGDVIAWNYYASVAAPFRAIVWRRTSSDTQFSIVGINDIPAGPLNKAVTHVVPKDERIEVRRGDLIGLAMNEVNAKVPYQNGGAETTQTRWLRNSNPSTLQAGDIVDLVTGVTDRSWSFSAQILGSPSLQATFNTDDNGKTIYQVLSEGKAMLELVAEFPNED